MFNQRYESRAIQGCFLNDGNKVSAAEIRNKGLKVEKGLNDK